MSPSTAARTSITFPVHDVQERDKELASAPTLELLAELTGSPVLATSVKEPCLLRHAGNHGLLGAAMLAWASHRSLILDPDTIWLTIAQQVASHIHKHAEELRIGEVSDGRSIWISRDHSLELLQAGRGEGSVWQLAPGSTERDYLAADFLGFLNHLLSFA